VIERRLQVRSSSSEQDFLLETHWPDTTQYFLCGIDAATDLVMVPLMAASLETTWRYR